MHFCRFNVCIAIVSMGVCVCVCLYVCVCVCVCVCIRMDTEKYYFTKNVLIMIFDIGSVSTILNKGASQRLIEEGCRWSR